MHSTRQPASPVQGAAREQPTSHASFAATFMAPPALHSVSIRPGAALRTRSTIAASSAAACWAVSGRSGAEKACGLPRSAGQPAAAAAAAAVKAEALAVEAACHPAMKCWLGGWNGRPGAHVALPPLCCGSKHYVTQLLDHAQNPIRSMDSHL